MQYFSIIIFSTNTKEVNKIMKTNFDVTEIENHKKFYQLRKSDTFFLIVKSNYGTILKIQGKNSNKLINLYGEDNECRDLLLNLESISIIAKEPYKPIKLLLSTPTVYSGIGFKNSYYPVTVLLSFLTDNGDIALISIVEFLNQKPAASDVYIAHDKIQRKKLANITLTLLSLLTNTGDKFEEFIINLTKDFPHLLSTEEM